MDEKDEIDVLSSDDSLYLAGPFFNVIQSVWAQRLASECRNVERNFYAPVLNQYAGGDSLEARAERIYTENVYQLEHASVGLFQLDWPNLPGHKTVDYIVKDYEIAKELNIPDSGTVWELGFMCAKRERAILESSEPDHPARIPTVVAYTLCPTEVLNLMLAKCADYFLSGEKEVIQFVRTGKLPASAKTWKGTVQ